MSILFTCIVSRLAEVVLKEDRLNGYRGSIYRSDKANVDILYDTMVALKSQILKCHAKTVWWVRVTGRAGCTFCIVIPETLSEYTAQRGRGIESLD